MSAKKNLFLVLILVALQTGCNLLADRQPLPNVATVPPYWQSRQGELEELRAFHEKESDKITTEAEDVHIVRNTEMERLAAANKELEREKLWQEDYEQTIERREKWVSWFNKEDEEAPESSPALSSNADTVNKSLR